MADDLLCHREKKTSDYRSLIPRLTDSVALLGYVHKELSFKRRDAIRPYLNPELEQACSRTLKPGKLLFGEDLSKTLQVLKTTSKIMNGIRSDNNKGNATFKHRSYGLSRANKQFRGIQSKPFWVTEGGTSIPP